MKKIDQETAEHIWKVIKMLEKFPNVMVSVVVREGYMEDDFTKKQFLEALTNEYFLPSSEGTK